MRFRTFLLIAGLAPVPALTSCLSPLGSQTSYQQLPPKTSPDAVEVFTEVTPKRPYKEIGHIELRSLSPDFDGYSTLVVDARRRAADMGADGIIVSRHISRQTETIERGTGRDRHFEYVVHETKTLTAVAIAWTDQR